MRLQALQTKKNAEKSTAQMQKAFEPCFLYQEWCR